MAIIFIVRLLLSSTMVTLISQSRHRERTRRKGQLFDVLIELLWVFLLNMQWAERMESSSPICCSLRRGMWWAR